MSVGAKRNALLSIAEGNYITFVDDDDELSPDYIYSIFEMIPKGFDVITYQVNKLFNGVPDRIQRFSRDYGLNHRSPDKKYNNYLPNHLCVWKRSVIKERFPDISLGEDHQWAQLMIPHYKTEGHIDKILYTYHFSKDTTETQER
jgi:glycosyltransferase involved in cell wall biosynthesis